MPIDVHAHYLPAKLVDIAEREGARFGSEDNPRALFRL